MPLFSAHTAASQNQKHNTTAGTNKPGLQTVSDDQPQTKAQHDTPKQMLSSAHKNTPCTAYAEGVVY